MIQDAITAIIFALFAIFVYIFARFEFKVMFSVGAVAALAHDVLITLGAIAVADTFASQLGWVGIKLDLKMVCALLTIVGYSLNDTIVVFDRIRENSHMARGRSFGEIINLSINQTLSRTILTSVTTSLVVLSLLLKGGDVIRGFAFALLVGVIVGTYSSVFIASPIVAGKFLKKEASSGPDTAKKKNKGAGK